MIKEGVICHAEGPRCLGCDHYHGRSAVCAYAPASDQPAPTPRTDEFLSKIPNTTQWYVFARQLERELSAARAEAERLREERNTLLATVVEIIRIFAKHDPKGAAYFMESLVAASKDSSNG